MKIAWSKTIKPLRALGKTLSIQCPKCSASEKVARTAVSVFCHSCNALIRVQEILHPKAVQEEKAIDQYQIRCFRCDTLLQAYQKAQSLLCKKCGSRTDLQDYTVKSVLSRNIETRGKLTVLANATVLNSTSRVAKAIIYGKYIGSLEADEIELKQGCHFEGNLKAGKLSIEIPLHLTVRKTFDANHFILKGPLKGKITISGTVEIAENSKFYGEIIASKLIVHKTAEFIGSADIDPSRRNKILPSKPTVQKIKTKKQSPHVSLSDDVLEIIDQIPDSITTDEVPLDQPSALEEAALKLSPQKIMPKIPEEGEIISPEIKVKPKRKTSPQKLTTQKNKLTQPKSKKSIKKKRTS